MSKSITWIWLFLLLLGCVKKKTEPGPATGSKTVSPAPATDSLDEIVLTPEAREALLIQVGTVAVGGVAWLGATPFNGKTDLEGFMSTDSMKKLWGEMASALKSAEQNQHPQGLLRFLGCDVGKISLGQLAVNVQPSVLGDARGVKECGYLIKPLNEKIDVHVEFTITGKPGESRQRIHVKKFGQRSAIFETVEPLPPLVNLLTRHSPESSEMSAQPFPAQVDFNAKTGHVAYNALGLNPLFYRDYPKNLSDMSRMWSQALANGQLLKVLGKAVELGFLYLNVRSLAEALIHLKSMQNAALVRNLYGGMVGKGKGTYLGLFVQHNAAMMNKFNWSGGKFQWQAKMAWAYFQVVSQSVGTLGIVLRLFEAHKQIEKMEEGPAKQGLMSSYNTLAFVSSGLDFIDLSGLLLGGVVKLGRFGISVGGKTFHYLGSLPFMLQNSLRVVFEQRAINAFRVAYQLDKSVKLDMKEYREFVRWVNATPNLKAHWEDILNSIEKNFSPNEQNIKTAYAKVESAANALVKEFKDYLTSQATPVKN